MPFVCAFVFLAAQIRQVYQLAAGGVGQFNCDGTVGWVLPVLAFSLDKSALFARS
jgi:hypothetical protein